MAEQKEMLLIASKTKEALKGGGKFNVSGDALEALNQQMYWFIEQAQKRCEANGRKTIKNYDILA
jgi:histone H3/H4